tara:strand:- start:1592 stop:2161 length:570 start_codon:yes stop_codon:yes gene_type:complete
MWVVITSIVEQTLSFMMALAIVVYFIMHSHEVHARKQHRFIWDHRKAVIRMKLEVDLTKKFPRDRPLYDAFDWALIVDTYFHVECMIVLRSLIMQYESESESISRKQVGMDSREWSFYTSQMVLHNTQFDTTIRKCQTKDTGIMSVCCDKPATLSEWLYTEGYSLFTGVVVPKTGDAHTPLLMLLSQKA